MGEQWSSPLYYPTFAPCENIKAGTRGLRGTSWLGSYEAHTWDSKRQSTVLGTEEEKLLSGHVDLRRELKAKL